MGLFNWLMEGIGFEGSEQEQENEYALKEEKRKYKEIKKQEKMAKKLAKKQAKNERLKINQEKAFVPSETVFSSQPEENVQQSSFDPDQYQIGRAHV